MAFPSTLAGFSDKAPEKDLFSCFALINQEILEMADTMNI